EIMRTWHDVEHRRLAVRQAYVAYAQGDIVLATDRLVSDDLREERGSGAIGLAGFPPTLMAHHDNRCAGLSVQIGQEGFLTPRDGQTVAEHHRQGSLTHAAPSIGDRNELSHLRAPRPVVARCCIDSASVRQADQEDCEGTATHWGLSQE